MTPLTFTAMSTESTDLDELSAADISRLIRSKTVSPVDTIRAAFERIERRNPSLNAVTFSAYEESLERADKLANSIAAGVDPGPLAGVPALMKDLFGHKPGWPATMGLLSALKRNRADTWSTFPHRVERYGGIVIGQTNSPAFGFRGTTDNKTVGPTRNPFDTEYNAGGSSGGSAAAVADGLVPLAGATDGGGSIRIPASWSGVVGFQPSAGRVPFVNRPNAFGLSCHLYEGPITRTVEDCALAMSALHGFDPQDPAAMPGRVDFLGALRRGIRGARVGFTADYGVFPVERAVAATVANAAEAFRELGATVDHIDLDLPYDQAELSAMWSRMTAIGVHEAISALALRGIDVRALSPLDLAPQMMVWVDAVPSLTITDIIRDQTMRTIVFDRFRSVFEEFDLIVAPTVACLPVQNSADGATQGPTAINGVPVDPLIGWCMTYLTNFTGNPSASVPVGLHDGLPVGMQVMGRRHDDTGVIAAIAAFERARPWSEIYRIPAARSL
ncbi:amidase [Mycolicibacterium sp. A43C]